MEPLKPIDLSPKATGFADLPMTWKVLSVMGIIFTLFCIALLILVILMFETDLVPWPTLETPSTEELEEEFGDFLKEFEQGVVEESVELEVELFPEEAAEYLHPLKDLDGNPVREDWMPDVTIF